MSKPAILSLHDISFEVETATLVDGVSFAIAPGEMVTLIGPNGAGKSTLVKILLGLLTPTRGHVDKPASLTFGYVPQRIALGPNMPMKVGRFMSLAKVPKSARQQALKTLNIEHLGQQQIHKLSGGELQRVLLARAIARKPDLLVLDEPAQGVDVNGQMALYRLIAQLQQQLHCAILMVSHDLHIVMAQTHSVICLNRHICCQGQAQRVRQHPEYLRLFGQQASSEIAVYQHHHDHHHNLHGDAVHGDERGR